MSGSDRGAGSSRDEVLNMPMEDEVRTASTDAAQTNAFEAKQTPTAIRVITVCSYMFFVSSAGIMLSLYYILMWNPPDVHTNYTVYHGRH